MAERDNVVDLLPWDIAVKTAMEKRSPQAILAREDADTVIAELSELEAYFAVKSLGIDDAAPFLAVLQPAQIVALVDLDTWRGGALDLDDLLVWLMAFREVSVERLVAVAHAVDQEVLALLLRRRLMVARRVRDDTGDLVPDWVESPPDDILPLVETPDGRFYIAARAADEQDDLEVEDGESSERIDEEGRKAIIELVLDLYKHDDFEHIAGILRLAETDLSSDVEETALRFRDARLEDLGFPARERAIEVYAIGDADRLVDGEGEALGASEGTRLPALFASGAAAGLFHAAMRAIEDTEAVRRIEGELVALANAVLVADGIQPGELARVGDVLTRVRATLELALAHRAGAVDVARDRLLRWPLRTLFSAGYGLTVRAASLARRVLASPALRVGDRAGGLLDDADRAVILALTRGPRPLYAAPGAVMPRPFGTPEELAQVIGQLGELEAWAVVAGRLELAAASAALADTVEPQEVLERTLGLLIGTLAAHVICGEAPSVAPLDAAALLALARAMAAAGVEDAARGAARAVALAGGRPEDDPAIAARVLRAVREVADALVPLAGQDRIDPRFVGGLLRARA